jgi:hypothetical protein
VTGPFDRIRWRPDRSARVPSVLRTAAAGSVCLDNVAESPQRVTLWFGARVALACTPNIARLT